MFLGDILEFFRGHRKYRNIIKRMINGRFFRFNLIEEFRALFYIQLGQIN